MADRFPEQWFDIFSWWKGHWLNDETIIELGHRKNNNVEICQCLVDQNPDILLNLSQ